MDYQGNDYKLSSISWRRNLLLQIIHDLLNMGIRFDASTNKQLIDELKIVISHGDSLPPQKARGEVAKYPLVAKSMLADLMDDSLSIVQNYNSEAVDISTVVMIY